jgi:hypothetical protein
MQKERHRFASRLGQLQNMFHHLRFRFVTQQHARMHFLMGLLYQYVQQVIELFITGSGVISCRLKIMLY